jgi:hypothetical protein
MDRRTFFRTLSMAGVAVAAPSLAAVAVAEEPAAKSTTGEAFKGVF